MGEEVAPVTHSTLNPESPVKNSNSKSVPLIIGISGKKRSGKDTVADFIMQCLPQGTLIHRSAFANALKHEVAEACDVPVNVIEQNKERFRTMLQWWGTEFRRQFCRDDYWLIRMEEDILRSCAHVALITDVRFPNELQYVEERAGITVRVSRLGSSLATDAHASETALDNADFDFRIPNHGDLFSLETKVREFVQQQIIPNL